MRYPFAKALAKKRPAQMIAQSFALLIVVGTGVLMLPFCSANGEMARFSDALFTATSATCVTGLVTVDTATHWSVWGQLVILLLIQLGGLGLVTFVTFFSVVLGRRLGLKSRRLATEVMNTPAFENASDLIRWVVGFSLLVELLGALLIYATFGVDIGGRGLFLSVFLSISAFCNAGFDPLGFESPFASLLNHSGNLPLLGVVMGLIVVGGLGFLVWGELLMPEKGRNFVLQTKIVLRFSLALTLFGAALFFLFEHKNAATLGAMPLEQQLTNALFASVTSRTAGFNSIDTAALTGSSKLLTCLLMLIGAAPGSTGGGIKLTTFAVMSMTVLGVVQGRAETVIFGRVIGQKTVYKAFSILTLVLLGVLLCTVVILISFSANGLAVTGLDAFFESASAFGTAGLSVGVTGIAPPMARLALILAMYLGRVGPVSFALALASHATSPRGLVLPEGKIMVG